MGREKTYYNTVFHKTDISLFYTWIVFTVLCFLLFIPNIVSAARLIVSPTTGTLEVNSTFSVSIFLDSEGESVNAFDVILNFPPDKLQLVSPSVGKSIAEIWTGAPQYNNLTGIVRFQGGIPNGITASRGLVSELIFRARRIGTAVISFADTSLVLRNDGKGTYVLNDTTRGVYQFVLPPPAGPIVASETHPDQTLWYGQSDIILRWGGGDPVVTEYSYMLSSNPVDVPDNIVDGRKAVMTYAQISNGTHYFHIKGLREGVWGGTTHFAVNVDTEPPAEFPIRISPSERTTSRNPIILFETTDRYSGIDHYEIKTVPLHQSGDNQIFFIEANSRQVLDLDLGRYDIIVRAYDYAGNVREVIKKITIVRPIFKVVQGQGIQIDNIVIIPWRLSLLVAIIVLGLLVYAGIRARRLHHTARNKSGKHAVKNELKDKFGELKNFRDKYTKAVIFLILSSYIVFGSDTAFAQTNQSLPPPLISTISENITNEDIFYVGGRTGNSGGDVMLYIQNLQSGEVYSQSVSVEDRNEWFYRHDSFLTSGDYTVWAQQKLGEQTSAPSPQTNLHVRTTAIQFGSSRLSLETVYLLLSLLLLLVAISLIGYIVFHIYHEKKWRARFAKEVNEAEDALRHGFMILRRDIQAELAIIQQAKLRGALAEKEEETEGRLLKDLEQIEKNIGKEILDIEQLEQ